MTGQWLPQRIQITKFGFIGRVGRCPKKFRTLFLIRARLEENLVVTGGINGRGPNPRFLE